MKRRRRIILKLLLFLFAGAIVNVAMAWGLHNTASLRNRDMGQNGTVAY
jgi:hypothetical protein